MVDIGKSDKITNLWPAIPGRPVDKSGLKERSSQNKQRNKQNKSKKEIKEDGPGNNIDEYV